MIFPASIQLMINSAAIGLTPLQRWDALTKNHTNSATNHLFISIGLSIIGVIATLMLYRILRHNWKGKRQNMSIQLFKEKAKEKNLTNEELNILLEIAVNAGLKRHESIFSLPSVFSREISKKIEQVRNDKGIDESLKLESKLTSIRNKLNFQEYTSINNTFAHNHSESTTRTIPVKKKIYLRINHPKAMGDLEARVISNRPAGLTIQFKKPVEVIFGQSWTCRYYSGAFVAEFNSMVLKCNGHVVVLKHSNHVHFINRRKYLRVPVKKPAYIAHFPFKKMTRVRKKCFNDIDSRMENTSNEISRLFELPRFVPATVIELGGPGLKITTDLNLNVGDRVLLMFDLNQSGDSGDINLLKTQNIIEHIAIVKHLSKTQSCSVVALELIGLPESNISELIRITNKASIEIKYYTNNHNSDRQKDETKKLLAV